MAESKEMRRLTAKWATGIWLFFHILLDMEGIKSLYLPCSRIAPGIRSRPTRSHA